MKKAIMLLIMCSLFWFSGPNKASAILLVDSGPAAAGGPNIFATDGIAQFLAQQFTLLTGATITEIAPFLGRIGTGPDPVVMVQVTNAIGPGTQPSNVFFQTLLTVNNPLPSAAFLPISTSFFLEAGTYFLVLSSDAELANSAVWGQDAPTDIGPDFRAFGPDINFAFPPASVFTGDFGDDLGLRISGDPISEALIDIKPGSDPNSINPRSRGVIPVAILTTDTFDATAMDPTTILFGATGTEASPMQSALEDVDGDGDTDMILHFKTEDTGILCGATSASLTGETSGGQRIQGSDSINTVGCKN